MGLRRRELLQMGALAALIPALDACGASLLPEPDVAQAGFGTSARGTVTMWCRAATVAGVQVVVDRFH